MTSSGAVSTGRLRIALLATAAVAVLEVVGGIRSGSLALLSDAAHVAMDVVALAIALAASVQALRPPTARQTYGFARYEILAALANGGLLSAVTILVVIEAVRRFAHPELPAGGLMTTVAAIGFVVNVAVGALLLRGSHPGLHDHSDDGHSHQHDLNLRAAALHVAGDALGSFGVVVGGVLIALTGAAWIDPAMSLFVSAIIVLGIVRVVREATDVLLESAPVHAEIPAVIARIRAVNGVVEVHHLHVWTLGSGSYALSAHVVLDDRKLSEASAILREIERAMDDDFAIGHVTIQFECETCDPETAIICGQAPTPESLRGIAAGR